MDSYYKNDDYILKQTVNYLLDFIKLLLEWIKSDFSISVSLSAIILIINRFDSFLYLGFDTNYIFESLFHVYYQTKNKLLYFTLVKL